ncbi:MAG: peroxiredoxin-like family protein [Burkholderiales bacterium]
MPMNFKPRQPVPALELATLGGGHFSLAAQKPAQFTMLVFYRGYHCPVCRKYLSELAGMLGEFDRRGVTTLAASSDTEERARMARDEWGLAKLPIGYGMTIGTAREWGLFVSTSRGKTSTGVEEPALFSEPGLFLVRPDGTLYWANISTMPFARPHFGEIAQAIDFVVSKDYPGRGEA